MKRTLEAILSLVLKCLFLYDLLHLCLIKPIERILYTRLSPSLIISSAHTLHMSFTFQQLLELRRIKSPVRKLFKIKSSFLLGLEKLDFSNGQIYYTYVNEVFFLILNGDKKMKDQGIIYRIISSKEKNQAEAKLFLTNPVGVWQELLSENRNNFIKFLFRKEKILHIEIMKF